MDQPKTYPLRAIPIIAFPLILGFASSLISRKAMIQFDDMNKPPFAPPAWLFPVAWSILYILMGVSFYIICISKTRGRDYAAAIVLFLVQLFFNILWSPIFFNTHMYLFAFVWLMIMWLMILVMMMFFFSVSRVAAILIIPYFIWCTFAAYLNAAFAYLAKQPLPL